MVERLDAKKSRDIRILANFVSIFCRQNHQDQAKGNFNVKDIKLRQSLGNKAFLLCPDCQKLLHHGIAKLLMCPYDPKPMCKKCQTHCYAPGYRERVREVMRFSGLYLVKRGRLDLLLHYLF